MKPAARALLEKLLRTRPKPDERALTELFMAIKAASIEELLELMKSGSKAASDGPVAVPPELEADVKKRLRKIKGKSQDFVPFLVAAIAGRTGKGRASIASGLTLSKALANAVHLLGDEASTAVDEAYSNYAKAYGVGYQLKSA